MSLHLGLMHCFHMIRLWLNVMGNTLGEVGLCPAHCYVRRHHASFSVLGEANCGHLIKVLPL